METLFPDSLAALVRSLLSKNMTWPKRVAPAHLCLSSHPEFLRFLPGILMEFSQVLSRPKFCSRYFHCASRSILRLPCQEGSEFWKTVSPELVNTDNMVLDLCIQFLFVGFQLFRK